MYTLCRTLRSASTNLVLVTRCNIKFGARAFRSAAPAIRNSLPCNVRYCETHNLSRLAWSWVGGRLAPFYIHQMNRVNSRNGSAMMTAP